MTKALQYFAAGVVCTFALALLGLSFGWLMVSTVEYFRPMLGVFGALMAFYAILAFVIGILTALFGASGKPAE